MRRLTITLHSFAAPLLLALPLADIDISEIGSFLKGYEFRQFIGEILIQITTGAVGGLVAQFYALLFGV